MNTAVVTGVSRGLGRSIAAVFVSAGWRVVGTGRSARPEDLDANIEYRQFDAADAAACAHFWEELQIEGEVCLVNNAGSYVQGGLLETAPEDYLSQMQSNYLAGVYMTRGLAEHVGQARIVNIISNSALVVHPAQGAYGAAKAAAQRFFQALQKEFPAEKYRITNLYPSDINSDGTTPNAIDPQDLAALLIDLATSQATYYPTDMTLKPVK